MRAIDGFGFWIGQTIFLSLKSEDRILKLTQAARLEGGKNSIVFRGAKRTSRTSEVNAIRSDAVAHH
jgi:hypothetical protein